MGAGKGAARRAAASASSEQPIDLAPLRAMDQTPMSGGMERSYARLREEMQLVIEPGSRLEFWDPSYWRLGRPPASGVPTGTVTRVEGDCLIAVEWDEETNADPVVLRLPRMLTLDDEIRVYPPGSPGRHPVDLPKIEF